MVFLNCHFAMKLLGFEKLWVNLPRGTKLEGFEGQLAGLVTIPFLMGLKRGL